MEEENAPYYFILYRLAYLDPCKKLLYPRVYLSGGGEETTGRLLASSSSQKWNRNAQHLTKRRLGLVVCFFMHHMQLGFLMYNLINRRGLRAIPRSEKKLQLCPTSSYTAIPCG